MTALPVAAEAMILDPSREAAPAAGGLPALPPSVRPGSPRRGRLRLLAAAALATLAAGRASAQVAAPGFALDRFVPAPAGAGWFANDDLAMAGPLGGAAELTLSQAHDPLVVGHGGGRLPVVSDEALAHLGASVNGPWWRLFLDLPMPLAVVGRSGVRDGYAYTAPAVNVGTNPDSLPDVGVGVEARLLGEADSGLRLGLCAQLFVPSNGPLDTPSTYLTDGTVRGIVRLLAAGDAGRLRWAGQAGVHLRPLDDAPIPGSPEGSEMLFAGAAGWSFEVRPGWALVAGPEAFGETALRSFFGGDSTGAEALLTGRFEGTGPGARLRVKLGAGGGLDPAFGAPEWRVVVAVELFSRPSGIAGGAVDPR